jgi:hypothetical protein
MRPNTLCNEQCLEWFAFSHEERLSIYFYTQSVNSLLTILILFSLLCPLQFRMKIIINYNYRHFDINQFSPDSAAQEKIKGLVELPYCSTPRLRK